MFNQTKLKQYAKIINLPLEEAEKVLRNQSKYLKISAEFLLKSFVVVSEAQKEIEAKKVEILKYTSKNILIVKYKDEILDLYLKENFGYLKISNAMKINHNIKISKSAIENFIKSNNIERVE
jgi:hypothetical protein